MNNTHLSGNLTRDPILRYTPSNHAVCSFTLAVNRRYKKGDQWEQETAFIPCECWGKTAELVSATYRKGSSLGAHGYLKEDQWEDKQTGQKRSQIKLVAQEVYTGLDYKSQTNPQTAARGGYTKPGPHTPVGQEDIPF